MPPQPRKSILSDEGSATTLPAMPDPLTSPSLPLVPLRRKLLRAAALVVITVLAYIPVYTAGFIWDDSEYVSENMVLRKGWQGLNWIWTKPGATPQYYPLTHTSFWLEWQLWQDNPAGYHVVNVVLHALSSVLLWRVLSLLDLRGAWLAAAIFAVHPVHVESVAWLSLIHI